MHLLWKVVFETAGFQRLVPCGDCMSECRVRADAPLVLAVRQIDGEEVWGGVIPDETPAISLPRLGRW